MLPDEWNDNKVTTRNQNLRRMNARKAQHDELSPLSSRAKSRDLMDDTRAGTEIPRSAQNDKLRFAAIVLYASVCISLFSARADVLDTEVRSDMVERAQQYLLSIQKNGSSGDSRRSFVTSLSVLAMLSSGAVVDTTPQGTAITEASEWVLKNSSTAFLGGREEPNADHAVASLMLQEMIGMTGDRSGDLNIHKRCVAALDYSIRIQDKGVGADFYGGWRRTDKTRVNDRVLTSWYLLALRSGALRGLKIPKGNLNRALEFVSASQKLGKTKPDEHGGFSVDAEGLAVRSTTAAGLLTLSLFDEDNEKAMTSARDWLVKHPARWHGPSFYESNFFAIRGLYRIRHLDDGEAFKAYYSRLANILKERQDADGSFPFPPGHGGPILAMGRGYSSAMAILILNVDRGIIPMDK